jgi:hypothetical protein
MSIADDDVTLNIDDELLCAVLCLLLEVPDTAHPKYSQAYEVLSNEADRRGLDSAAYCKEKYDANGELIKTDER